MDVELETYLNIFCNVRSWIATYKFCFRLEVFSVEFIHISTLRGLKSRPGMPNTVLLGPKTKYQFEIRIVRRTWKEESA